MKKESCLSCDNPEYIFVFGSNEAGIHGAGAALHARRAHGARMDHGVGLRGKSYAIPTKNGKLERLPIEKIARYVEQFLDFAQQNPTRKFFVTKIGTGLAGLKVEQIAPLFRNVPENVLLPKEFIDAERGKVGSFGSVGEDEERD